MLLVKPKNFKNLQPLLNQCKLIVRNKSSSKITSDYTFDSNLFETDPKFQAQVNYLINEIIPHEPSSTSSKTTISRLSGGLTNKVYKVSTSTKPKLDALLRIYGSANSTVIDRELELKVINKLSESGIGPKLLSQFKNGRLEEYLLSTTLTSKDLRDPIVFNKLAKVIGELHLVKTEQDVQPQFWINVSKWLAALSDQPVVGFKIKDIMPNASKLKKIIDQYKSPIVICHNDLQYGNILKMTSDNSLKLIDFEYAGPNHPEFDLANYFCEWMANYEPNTSNKDTIDIKLLPTKEQQIEFLSAYLDSVQPKLFDGIDAITLQKRMFVFTLASHLHWGLWGLIQHQTSDISFDYLNYAKVRLAMFSDGVNKISLV